MTRIQTRATIRRTQAEVFDYVTTPDNWRQWHPSTIAVTGDASHPLDVGERCSEEFVVAGRRGVTDWTVLRRERPSLWVIEARPPTGAHALITYELAPEGDGTIFTRTLEYTMPNAFLRVMDVLIIRHRVTRESERAVSNLKARLEERVPVAT